MSPRARILAVCSTLVVALLAVAALAPLPFSIAYPGLTANVLGTDQGKPVITITGAETRQTSGQLRMTAIVATGPDADIRLKDVVSGWFNKGRAVMPRDSVYPSGDSPEEVDRHNRKEMEESQHTAVKAALGYLNRSPKDVKVTLRLAGVGGPSAGLMFTLGIVDKLDGDGRGGDLTGGRVISGTGTIDADGKVGPVGGVGLKPKAAKRDGASVFLVPKEQCSDVTEELPKGLKLIPVKELGDAVTSLRSLAAGKPVPSC
ncbi:S16 family serine protease [Streptomyces sp. HSW2009]|uniref:S16 family serine protease n=1 Tax=Streptomyces sp. HSW2009 TaxID=3142890 RepID=UPI0032EFEE1B